MLKLEKVATPFTAATVAVPNSEAPLGLVPSATVTLVVALVTVFPDASWIATWSAGAIGVPAAALPGCTVKASFVATLVVPVGAELPHAPSATMQAVKRNAHPRRRQVRGETIVPLQHCKREDFRSCHQRIASRRVSRPWVNIGRFRQVLVKLAPPLYYLPSSPCPAPMPTRRMPCGFLAGSCCYP